MPFLKTKIPQGTAQNGITTYPVVVKLDESEGLLPGMNVTGVIKLEEASDTLYVPSGALQRGDLVYVKNESLTADNDTASAGTDYTGDDFAADSDSDTGFSESFEAYDVPEGFTAVKVKTGNISDQYVEILEGLSEGQEVYVKDTASDDMFGGDMFMYGGPGYYG